MTTVRLMEELDAFVEQAGCDCGGSHCISKNRLRYYALRFQQIVAEKCAEIASQHEDNIAGVEFPAPAERAIRRYFGLDQSLPSPVPKEK